MTAVLFDLDGTLTDPRVGITECIRHGLRAVGVDPPAAAVLEQYIGPPLQETFRSLMAGATDGIRARALAAYRERFARVGMFENRLFDGIPACLDALRRAGHDLFVVTTKPTVFAARIVEHFALAEDFRAVHGSELDGTRAAKPDLIAHVLHAERLDAGEAVMVGDRRHDIEGARANRVPACGVTWGFGSRAELVAAGAEMLADTPAALVRLLGS